MSAAEKTKLRSLMECPVDWQNETGLADWDYGPLEHNWYYVFMQQAIASEQLVCDVVDDALLDDDDPELADFVKNAELRRPRAVEQYRQEAGRLSGFKFVTASDVGKHFVCGLDQSAITRLTLGGPSLFYKDYAEADLRDAFWIWFLSFFDFCESPYDYRDILSQEREAPDHPRYRFWDAFLRGHQLRICFDAVRPIGASDGTETKFVCFDVHIGAKTVHAYPVTRADAASIMGRENIEVNGFLSGC